MKSDHQKSLEVMEEYSKLIEKDLQQLNQRVNSVCNVLIRKGMEYKSKGSKKWIKTSLLNIVEFIRNDVSEDLTDLDKRLLKLEKEKAKPPEVLITGDEENIYLTFDEETSELIRNNDCNIVIYNEKEINNGKK